MLCDPVQNGTPLEEAYGSDYYASHCGIPYSRDEPHWSLFFGNVADHIVRSLRPKRVFDAGCAHGFLVEALWDRGVEAYGRDISSYAVSQARSDLRSFISQGSIAQQIDGEYDLITCVEVLEHMEENDSISAIAMMAASSPKILFSSSPSDLTETTHINVKPVIWWLRRFADVGMAPVGNYDASFITAHAFLLERTDDTINEQLIYAFSELVRQRMLILERDARLSTIARISDAEKAKTAEDAARLQAGWEQATSKLRAEIESLNAEKTRTEAQIHADWEQATSKLKAEIESLNAEKTRTEAQIHADWEQATSKLKAEIETLMTAKSVAECELGSLRNSTIWRASRPLRSLGDAMPLKVRSALKSMLPRGARPAIQNGSSEELPATITRDVEHTFSEIDNCGNYSDWLRRCDTLDDSDRRAIETHIKQLAYRPLISVVMPAYNSPEKYLREAIASVQRQIYPHWELCVADDASSTNTVANVLAEFAAEDTRVKWVRRDKNGHIAAASNSAMALACGEFIAFLDHDDTLAEHALYEVAVELNVHPDTDLIYSDEDRMDCNGRRHSPYFKPDWNIDLMLGHNVFNHFGVYRKSLLEEIGGFREGLVDGSQDYDLTLRAVSLSERSRIRHIPAVLYHWRETSSASSFSQLELEKCVAAARLAVGDYLNGQGIVGAELLPAPGIPSWTRVRWPLPEPTPRVSIVIPTRNGTELLARCVAGILHRTDYDNLELVIVDNGSEERNALLLFERLKQDQRVKVLSRPGPFNYSALNNTAVAEATGSIVLLLNNDIDVIDHDWLREIVSLVVRPDVGAVGAKLLYPDNRIQHAGVVLGDGSHKGGAGVAGHLGLLKDDYDLGYFGQFALARELAAVTGACLAVRKDVYEAVGGLDTVNLPVAFNDIDLCLRIRESGLRILWTPFSKLYHLESASRGSEDTPEKQARATRECDFMRGRWGEMLDNDPFYNANFLRGNHAFRLAIPARREKPWRRHSARGP